MTNARARLGIVTRWKATRRAPLESVGDAAVELFEKQIRKRHKRFGNLSRAWEQLIPDVFQPRTYLASFTRGTLCVHVDSASHLYELRQLLLTGIEQQLLAACAGDGLRKITLKRGPVEV